MRKLSHARDWSRRVLRGMCWGASARRIFRVGVESSHTPANHRREIPPDKKICNHFYSDKKCYQVIVNTRYMVWEGTRALNITAYAP